MKIIFVLFGGVFLLQSCVYPISRDLVDRSDKNVTFEMLRYDPDLYKGKLLILGGSIVQVTSLAQGSLIEVKQSPLDYWGKPIRTSASREHFLIYSPAYIDPGTYAPERQLTVAGEVRGTSFREPGAASETAYPYPVIHARELKLWPHALRSDQPDWLDPLYNMQQSPVQPQY